MNTKFLTVLAILPIIVIANSNNQQHNHKLDKTAMRPTIEDAKLIPDEGFQSGRFGWSVSISGQKALVGAYNHKVEDITSGVAYLYEYDTNAQSWVISQRIEPEDYKSTKGFGFAVNISHNRMVIGAPYDSTNGFDSGAAYIFDYDGNTWNQTKKIIADDSADEDFFGHSVAQFENKILIGAYKDDDKNGMNSGSVYAFELDGNNWNQMQKLTTSDGAAEDFFGDAISIYEDVAMISAENDDDNGSDSGSVYVFKFYSNNWHQILKLSPNDGQSEENFGTSISIFGQQALIGAPGGVHNGINSGTAYLYEQTGNHWSQKHKFVPSNPWYGDSFGSSVSITTNQSVIGAPNQDNYDISTGAVYLFNKHGSQWQESKRILPFDRNGGFFGYSVSHSENIGLFGAFGDSVFTTFSGSAYISDLDGIFKQSFELD